MTELFSKPFGGKVIMQEMCWKYLKCVDCDCDMILNNVTEYEEVKICPKCGRKELLIKKIREERTSMIEKEFCPKCGKEMVEGDYGPFVDYFCENCGESVRYVKDRCFWP